jgi:hypothetical protein
LADFEGFEKLPLLDAVGLSTNRRETRREGPADARNACWIKYDARDIPPARVGEPRGSNARFLQRKGGVRTRERPFGVYAPNLDFQEFFPFFCRKAGS